MIALIERFQPEHDLQTAGVPHGGEQFARQMLLEAHFAGPFDVEPAVDHLLAEPLGRRQREAFVGKEEVPHAVPLFEPFQFFDRPARLLLPEILVIEGQARRTRNPCSNSRGRIARAAPARATDTGRAGSRRSSAPAT